MILLLSLLLLQPAHAARETLDSGTSIGNGGMSVVCPKEGTAEALDLFEGRALSGYQIAFPETSDPYELAMKLAIKLDESQGGNEKELDTLQGKLKFIKENMNFLPSGVGLRPTDDSYEFIVPKGCEIAQTIVFRQNRKIHVDSDVWNLLSNTSRAALYLHEAVYWQLRESGVENDSRRTRRVVAFMMSGGEMPPRAKIPLPPDSEIQYCHSLKINPRRDYNTKFFAYRIGSKLILQFLQVGGFRLLGRAEIVADAVTENPSLPVQKMSRHMERVEGWIGTPPDSEVYTVLTWGQGRIQIGGYVQQGIKLWDELECEDWFLSW